MEQNSNQQPAADNQQIVNTEAAKAKANELVGKAKEGVEYYKKNIKTDKKLWIGTAVVALVVVLLLVSLMGGSGKGAAKKYANAMVKGDAKALMSVLHEDFVESFDDILEYGDYDDLEEMWEEAFESREDEDIEYKGYEITDVKKDYDRDDIEDVAEYLNDAYDIDEDSVKNVVRYTIKFEVEYDGDDETEKEKVFFVKIGSKWYYFGEDVGL